MDNFWDLVRFEYKKILCKKSVSILFILAIGFTIFRYMLFSDSISKGTNGVEHFFSMVDTTILLIFFVTAICTAPIFSDEYTSKVDKLILSSKNGKGKLISAKIFTSISLSSVICISLTLTTYLGSMILYGFDGNIKMLMIYCCCLFLANLFSTVIVILLSVKLKSSFSTVVVSVLLIIISRMMNFPESYPFIRGITNLLPIKMANISILVSPISYEIYGMQINSYLFVPVFAIITSIVIIPFIYQGFRNHQVH